MNLPLPGLASAVDLAQIAQFNRTEAPFPDGVPLQRLIESRVAQNPAATAVICDHDRFLAAPSLSYAEWNERANQIARELKDLGVRRGDVVALKLERSFAMMIGLLGAMKAGAAYLPLAPDHPPERAGYMLKDAGVRVVLAPHQALGSITFEGKVVDLHDPQLYFRTPTNPSVANGARDLAYVIYTSGSTGTPKGVMIEHRSLVNRLAWMQHAYPIGPGDVILQKTPYTFDVSLWELFWWALQGASVCMLVPGGERNPLAIVDAIRKHRVTVMHFVPSMLSVFLHYLEAKPSVVEQCLGSVRRVFASGEALTPSHVRRFHEIWGSRTGTQLTNLYGPTEATVDVSYFDCPPGALDSVPIGRPIHNTRFYVIREGAQVPIGEVGELCIAGVNLARGYLNQPALTAEKFTDNPACPGERIYRTGDLARWRPDGNVEYLGREDHQVKIRGLRIELGEIEERIRGYPGVADCAVIVSRYSESVVLLLAYVVCSAEVRFDALKDWLRRFLPEYMIPNRFEQLQEMPLTSSGKVNRKALDQPPLTVGP